MESELPMIRKSKQFHRRKKWEVDQDRRDHGERTESSRSTSYALKSESLSTASSRKLEQDEQSVSSTDIEGEEEGTQVSMCRESGNC